MIDRFSEAFMETLAPKYWPVTPWRKTRNAPSRMRSAVGHARTNGNVKRRQGCATNSNLVVSM